MVERILPFYAHQWFPVQMFSNHIENAMYNVLGFHFSDKRIGRRMGVNLSPDKVLSMREIPLEEWGFFLIVEAFKKIDER